jgi:threonine/homoserine/homoserine lactone efflux protein
MDIESRLQKIEAQVYQIKILVWVILALVLAFGLGFLPAYLPSIVVILTLIAMAYLLFVAVSGWRQLRTSRQMDAELQDRILREIVAERAKARGQDPNP